MHAQEKHIELRALLATENLRLHFDTPHVQDVLHVIRSSPDESSRRALRIFYPGCGFMPGLMGLIENLARSTGIQ